MMRVARQVAQVVAGLLLTSLLVLRGWQVPGQEQEAATTFTFPLEQCPCSRTLPLPSDSNATLAPVALNLTTCSRDAWRRGPHQRVAAFSFYGDTRSKDHKYKQYFTGISENLELLTSLYGEGWVLRLYYDLDPADSQLQAELCDLACANTNIDLCNIKSLPGTPVTDASEIFAMNWRFFPTLDPQVDLYLCRDLDSRISSREVAATAEWIQSGQGIHSMRDHPAHNTPLLGASWGARLDLEQTNVRHKWARAWDRLLRDPLARAPRGDKGPDQTLLQRHVWPWARWLAMQHDSYTCHLYPHTLGWPTPREEAPNNFVAAVVTDNATLWQKCPKKCRRKGHMDWEHC